MKSVVLVMVYISLMLLLSHTTRASLAKPGCQERCGNIPVPYPYGIGAGCYLHKSFEVLCIGSSHDLAPLRFVYNHEFPIIEISMESLRVLGKPDITCNDSGIKSVGRTVQLDRHFTYSHHRNVFVAVGCDISATFQMADTTSDEKELVGCDSFCMMLSFNGFCNDIGCQRNIRIEDWSHNVQINKLCTCPRCSGGFIVEKEYHLAFRSRWQKENFPVALNWIIGLGTCHQALERGDSLCGQNSNCVDTTMGHGYNCRCMEGYKGNPYLRDGCEDINECVEPNNHPCTRGELCVNTPGSYECILQHGRHKQIVWGIIAIVIGLLAFGAFGYLVLIKLPRREKNIIKMKFFIRNGGNLLKQHISTNRSSVIKIKIYAAEEMEKATEGFSRKRFLGKGGQGTVYKGLLSGGTVVAVKKSNAVDKDQVEQFVNELLILAQINHRNIVKLLGCCLEYEVPLLVYEYLSNGTLSEHLFDGEVCKFSWKDRIRIAKEVAEALAYLHSYASSVIFHRDIKPVNILLDENYRAVLSDFGISRSIPLSRTHLTTQVEGTFGYLDPEYFQSGQFTAKSDVYAFGVVLTELLTRRKAVSSVDADEGLIPRFQDLMKYNRVFEILDKQITHESWMDEVLLVAKLAKRCMKRNAKKRPSMKEVVADLDKIRLAQPEFPLKSVIDDFTSTL